MSKLVLVRDLRTNESGLHKGIITSDEALCSYWDILVLVWQTYWFDVFCKSDWASKFHQSNVVIDSVS